jgi:hypothetical protein
LYVAHLRGRRMGALRDKTGRHEQIRHVHLYCSNLSVGSDRRFTAEEMRVLPEAEISREIMRCWFPVFDEDKGN